MNCATCGHSPPATDSSSHLHWLDPASDAVLQQKSGRAEADLAAAEQLVAETEAHALQPLIHEERAALTTGAVREAALREALRLYEEMGATGHAKRLSSLIQ